MAKKKIVSFDNLKSFKEKLDNVAEIELAKKQDNLVSGENIKTVAGQDITGAGNVSIDVIAPKIVINEEQYESQDGSITIPSKEVNKVGIDDAPVEDSQNLVRSGGVYSAIIGAGVIQNLLEDSAFTITAQEWTDLKANHYLVKNNITISGLINTFEFVNIKFTFNGTTEFAKLNRNKATQYISIFFIEENTSMYEITVGYTGTELILRCAQVY